MVQKKGPPSPSESSIDSLEIGAARPDGLIISSGSRPEDCVVTTQTPDADDEMSLISPVNSRAESESVKRTSHNSLDAQQSKAKLSTEFCSGNLFYTPGKSAEHRSSFSSEQPTAGGRRDVVSSPITPNQPPSSISHQLVEGKPPLRKTSSNDPAILYQTPSDNRERGSA